MSSTQLFQISLQDVRDNPIALCQLITDELADPAVEALEIKGDLKTMSLTITKKLRLFTRPDEGHPPTGSVTPVKSFD